MKDNGNVILLLYSEEPCLFRTAMKRLIVLHLQGLFCNRNWKLNVLILKWSGYQSKKRMTTFAQMVILRYQLNGKTLSREIKTMNRKKKKKGSNMWRKHYFKVWRFYFNTEMDSHQQLGSEYSLNFLEAQVWTLKPAFTFRMSWTVFQILYTADHYRNPDFNSVVWADSSRLCYLNILRVCIGTYIHSYTHIYTCIHTQIRTHICTI